MKPKGFLRKTMNAAAIALALVIPQTIVDNQTNPFAGAPPLTQTDDFSNVEVVDQLQFRHEKASESDDAVGTQLILAMDTSGSMSDEEFEVELRATAQAINSELFRNAVKYKTGEKSVAIVVIDFDSIAMMRIPWVDIRGDQINDKPYDPDNPSESSAAPDKLDELAKEIITLPRRGSGGTSISSAMRLSKNLFLGSPWEVAPGGKRVLDVFGDGTGSAFAMRAVRSELAMMGVTINGFAIVNEVPSLERHFKQDLVTLSYTKSPDGVYSEPGRVWAVARNLQSTNNSQRELKSFFGEVATAMKQKVTVELAGVDDYKRILVLLERKQSMPIPKPA